MSGLGVTEANWRDHGRKDRNFLASESPLFVGRAVVALALDERLLERSGKLLSSWELARGFGFTDADGRRPDWGAVEIDVSQLPPSLLDVLRTGSDIQVRWLERTLERTQRCQSQLSGRGKPAQEA